MSSDDPLRPAATAPPRPWTRHGERPGHDYRIFRSRFDELENPRTGERMERVVLETPDWVNVVATTAEGEVVLVRQFRFGTGEATLEVPGGMVDPGEEPIAAARRELREETGFVAERWTSLGFVEPNPAFQTNRCHHFLAEGARRDGGQQLDAGEDIVVTTMCADTLRRAIAAGEMTHALALTAVMRVLDLRTHPISPPPSIDGDPLR